MAVTPKQFEQMQARLANPNRTAAPVFDSSLRASTGGQIILGIDPSLRGTGFGVIQPAKPFPKALAYGTIRCPAGWERSRCLAHISRTLRDLINKHHPQICAIEGLFYAQNLQTALLMGEARGAALAVLGEAALEIYEVAPRKVKLSMVGYGAAQKLAVGKMVQRLLRLAEAPEPDAADALAVALAHLQDTGRVILARGKKL